MYNEENQDRGAELMVAAGFKMGRIIYPTTETTIPNVAMSTIEDGFFWYGDVSESEIPKLNQIASQLKRTLILESQTGNKTLRVSASV